MLLTSATTASICSLRCTTLRTRLPALLSPPCAQRNPRSLHLEKSTTVMAALTQADIDAEYIRSLDRQFAKHQLEADQSRLSPRARK